MTFETASPSASTRSHIYFINEAIFFLLSLDMQHFEQLFVLVASQRYFISYVKESIAVEQCFILDSIASKLSVIFFLWLTTGYDV